MNVAEVAKQLERCNEKKTKSRHAQEACDVAFFCMYLRRRGTSAADLEIADKVVRERRLAELAKRRMTRGAVQSDKGLYIDSGTVLSIMDKQIVVFVPILGKEGPVYFKMTSTIPQWYLPDDIKRLGRPLKFFKSNDKALAEWVDETVVCLLYTSPSPRDRQKSRMPSSA